MGQTYRIAAMTIITGAIAGGLLFTPAVSPASDGSVHYEASGGAAHPERTRDVGLAPVVAPSGYLSSVYVWFLGFVGIAALFGIVTGGVMYMFAGANIGSVEQAKKWIWNAIYGLALAAASVLLLRTINPDLVQGFNLEQLLKGATRDSNLEQPTHPPEGGVNAGVEG